MASNDLDNTETLDTDDHVALLPGCLLMTVQTISKTIL